MRRILLAFLCLLALPLSASHIVGGEFEILHLSDYNYRINLLLYFDQLNGNPGARDTQITAAIFRKRDNVLIRTVTFNNYSTSAVNYTQPECSNGEIVTQKLTYTTTVVLSPDIYNDPEGYYIVWERCCRNYTITNIYSDDPQFGGIAAGQTFYLEFPPVVINGEQFINSSPRLFPPLNDYACPRKPYYVDFAGTDDDGDSLVYSLVTPLSTHTVDALPPISPAPYPPITWRNPFNINNIINGMPDLRISGDGFLTVTPTLQGLFVFAVRCEEFREGIKIGELRRDFQMLVVDVCPQADPPQILGKKIADADFTFDNTMSVSFSNTVTNEARCINVRVSDPDASKQDDNFQEKVKIRVIPLNFKGDVSGMLPQVTNALLVNGSIADFDICFPDCPLIPGPYQIGVIAYDDACSLPLSDTLKVTVNVQPPANAIPQFTTPNVTATLNEGDKVIWPIEVTDADMNPMTMALLVNGFNLAAVGMEFKILENVDGSIKAQLEWDTRCDVYDFTKQTFFNLKVLVEDMDYCNTPNPVFAEFKLTVILPGNQDPRITTTYTPASERRVENIEVKVYESLQFNVIGSDLDNDYLLLGAKGIGFNMADYSVSFNNVEGNGVISSPFRWDLFCDNVDLSKKDEFDFEFIVVDNANKCRLYKADTVNVVVKVLPPDNAEPALSIASLNPDHEFIDGELTTYVGEQISLGLYGNDSNTSPSLDFLRLEMIKAEGTIAPRGYVYADATGRGSVETTFNWLPDCSIFENQLYENEYAFAFRVLDDRCFNQKGDTLEIKLKIKDYDHENLDFLPPNFISPNGDDLNDYFAMVRYDESLKELVSILPVDNCIGTFVDIRIYNRWGRAVYESTNRDFKWYAENLASGVYYYTLQYTHKQYKGSITVHY